MSLRGAVLRHIHFAQCRLRNPGLLVTIRIPVIIQGFLKKNFHFRVTWAIYFLLFAQKKVTQKKSPLRKRVP